VLVVVAASCGTRVPGPPEGSGGVASAPTGGSSGSAASVKFGTLASPCGPAPSGTPSAPAGGAPGVTADTIRIGVISDRTGPVPVPTAGIDGSMTAFAEWCNAQGGINGRKLDLQHYDSATLAENEAMTKACGDNLFALVGSGSVQDDAGAETMVKCGLVEVAGYTATYPKGLSPRLVQPVPNPGDHLNVGPGKFIAKKFPKAIKSAGEFFPSYPPIGGIQANRIKDGYAPLGFDFKMVQPTDIILGIEGWGQWVNQMRGRDLQWVSGITFTQDTVAMLAAMSNAGVKPAVIDLGQQYYDASVPGKPGTEGILVLTNTSPFEDTDNAAIREYVKQLGQYSKDTPPTSLGVQSFSAGLLFAQAAKSLGDHLTRDGLLVALKGIHEWDGGGLHMPTDPGANAVTTCFLYMTVRNGKWARYWPTSDKDGTHGFDCDPGNAAKLPRSYAPLPPGWTTGR
jgi:ABC-type branched-subunit amino acid transport system substrate-binding protein